MIYHHVRSERKTTPVFFFEENVSNVFLRFLDSRDEVVRRVFSWMRKAVVFGSHDPIGKQKARTG